MMGMCMDVCSGRRRLDGRTILSDIHRRKNVSSRGESEVGIAVLYRSMSISWSGAGEVEQFKHTEQVSSFSRSRWPVSWSSAMAKFCALSSAAFEGIASVGRCCGQAHKSSCMSCPLSNLRQRSTRKAEFMYISRTMS